MNTLQKERWKKISGWAAYILSVLLTSLWAFWGSIENFHEGWYHPSFLHNLGLMFIQYLSPALLFILLTLFAVWKNKIGAMLFLLAGIGLALWVNKLNLFVILPFFLLATLFWFGELSNKKRKYKIVIILPLLIFIAFGIEPAYRISMRYNDGDFGQRLIESNGVALVWAPRGPGWPDEGVNWYEADSICRYLTEDGLHIAAEPQNIWRLPTVEEAVRSTHRHGKNCRGYLDKQGNPVYAVEPDKETPLWNPHTMVIYWWTGSEIDSAHAYIIAYNGKIWKREKSFGPNYLGFRAVKDPEENQISNNRQ